MKENKSGVAQSVRVALMCKLCRATRRKTKLILPSVQKFEAMKKTKRYDQAFKDEAVKLSYERGSASSAAWEMGVSYATIRRWQKERGDEVEKLSDEQAEDKNMASAALAFWWCMNLI